MRGPSPPPARSRQLQARGRRAGLTGRGGGAGPTRCCPGRGLADRPAGGGALPLGLSGALVVGGTRGTQTRRESGELRILQGGAGVEFSENTFLNLLPCACPKIPKSSQNPAGAVTRSPRVSTAGRWPWAPGRFLPTRGLSCPAGLGRRVGFPFPARPSRSGSSPAVGSLLALTLNNKLVFVSCFRTHSVLHSKRIHSSWLLTGIRFKSIHSFCVSHCPPIRQSF